MASRSLDKSGFVGPNSLHVSAGWRNVALKHLVSEPITDGPHETPEFVDSGIPFISAEAVWDGRIHFESMRGFISPDAHQLYSKKYRPRSDDIYFVKSGATTGKVAIVGVEREFNIWSPLAVIRCNRSRALPKFVFHSLASDYFQGQVRVSWSLGTQPNIGMEVLENLFLMLPSLSQQKTIADYLDRETERIDALVAQKARVLKLLAEKRRALISHAITRGINPNVAFRDSGIPWLGRIPAHWETLHLKRVLSSIDYGISDPVEPSGSIIVLRMGDLTEGEINFSRVGFVDQVDSELLLRPGDLVFNRTNSLDQVAKVGLLRAWPEQPVTFASYLVRLRCTSRAHPEYLCILLNAQFTLHWARSEALPAIGQVNLNPNRYSYLKICLPPIEEQDSIVNYIKSRTGKLDALRSATDRSILLLKERRAALISAAVTGQIDIKA